MSGSALRVSHTEATVHVEALFAPTDSVADRCALFLYLLVPYAEVVAVQTLWQVVPKLGEVVFSALQTLGGLGVGAVRGHVCAWWALVAVVDFPSELVLMLIRGS